MYELLGYVPLGTYCYVCGGDPIREYNNKSVCKECFDVLEMASKETYVYNRCRYFSVGKNTWIPESYLSNPPSDKPLYSYHHDEFHFATKYPEKMLKLAFSKCYYYNHNHWCNEKSLCLQCDTIKYFTYDEVCKECSILAILYYFELEPEHFFYLKQIYLLDIAKYIILHYFDLKLRCAYLPAS